MDDRAHRYPDLTIVGSAKTSVDSQSISQGLEVVLERGIPVKTS
jgi:hypothetical protein